MISHLRGTVIDKDIRHCTLDVGGVGYKVAVTEETLRTLKNGEIAEFWTHLSVREDAMDLYGFMDKESLGLFGLLINISGIGPKTALGVINVASPQTLRRAVSSGDLAYLTKVSGIGRKLAEKIILELREKIDIIGGSEENMQDINGEADVIEALKSLGYSERESREALKKLSADGATDRTADGITNGAKETTGKKLSTGDKVKKALKILGGGK